MRGALGDSKRSERTSAICAIRDATARELEAEEEAWVETTAEFFARLHCINICLFHSNTGATEHGPPSMRICMALGAEVRARASFVISVRVAPPG